MAKIQLNLLIIGLLFYVQNSFAQKLIQLKNPSFEGSKKIHQMPDSWLDCGSKTFPKESPISSIPMYQPDSLTIKPTFNIYTPPFHGKKYLQFAVRENNTWESLVYKYNLNLEGGKVYEFSLFLNVAEHMESPIKTGLRKPELIIAGKPVYNVEIKPFSNACILKIWGSNTPCKKEELLAQSQPIIRPIWKNCPFRIRPQKDYKYLIFESYFLNNQKPYNGNLLMDNMSHILEVEKDSLPYYHYKHLDRDSVVSLLRLNIAQFEKFELEKGEFQVYFTQRPTLHIKLQSLFYNLKSDIRYKLVLLFKENDKFTNEKIKTLEETLVLEGIPEWKMAIHLIDNFPKKNQDKVDWLYESSKIKIGLEDLTNTLKETTKEHK